MRCNAATVACARSFSPSSSALLMGCSITQKSQSGKPSTRLINSAAFTKLLVITPTDGVPASSEATASCKLHDEQLPQSPIPVIATSQCSASLIIEVSAGAL